MDFLNFVPIEYRGISIISLLLFGFYGIWLKNTNSRITKYSNELKDGLKDIAEMKTNIALTLQTVTRMATIMDKEVEINWRRKDK